MKRGCLDFNVNGIKPQVCILVEPEDFVGDFYMDSGDLEFDKKCIDELHEALDRGEFWECCRIQVSVHIGAISGEDTLGGCSISESEFDYLTEPKNWSWLNSSDAATVSDYGMLENALAELMTELKRYGIEPEWENKDV